MMKWLSAKKKKKKEKERYTMFFFNLKKLINKKAD